jgi:hypothetical protein
MVLNRSESMVVPAGASTATGLREALAAFGASLHSIIERRCRQRPHLAHGLRAATAPFERAATTTVRMHRRHPSGLARQSRQARR